MVELRLPTAARWWHHLSDEDRAWYVQLREEIRLANARLGQMRLDLRQMQGLGELRCREAPEHLHSMDRVIDQEHPQ